MTRARARSPIPDAIASESPLIISPACRASPSTPHAPHAALARHESTTRPLYRPKRPAPAPGSAQGLLGGRGFERVALNDSEVRMGEHAVVEAGKGASQR